MDENNELRTEHDNGESSDKQNKNSKIGVKDIIEAILGLVILAIFAFIIIGAFSSDCIQCTLCGDNNNRLFVYANGKDEEGVEYISCLGPAGCLGCGINSKCWPTECLYVKHATDTNQTLSGCVTFYNEGGCIAKSNVKSVGKYSDQSSCLGISCSGENYVEVKAESAQASEQNTCLGFGCGNKVDTTVRGYNEAVPRQFRNGCWTNGEPEEGGE